jgi:3-oxoadipate enol-lactonase
MIGFNEIGTGPTAVLVMHDWLGDTSSWDGARPYLDLVNFRWIFADLRGYGRSMAMQGQYTADEAAADVLALADHLQLPQFSVIGHSMSSMVVLALLRRAQARIERAVVLTPPPPTGMALAEPVAAFLLGMANGDDTTRYEAMLQASAGRLSPQWVRFKIDRWRAASDSKAVAAYVGMFGGSHPAPVRVTVPFLIVTGECDSAWLRSAPQLEAYGPHVDLLEVVGLADCGHYPMQEAPPLLTTVVQRFLAQT